jgi:pyruvate/2-oxoglutarate dehydrogenase complex dihydrolipoamide acyltransferase (E2) component
MTWSPNFYISNVGSCGLTLMDGHSFDRFLPIAPTSVVFAPGAVRNEPVVRGKEITSRRVMKSALMVDNFVISGPTGAKLGDTLQALLESGSFIRAEIEQAPKQKAQEVADGRAVG